MSIYRNKFNLLLPTSFSIFPTKYPNTVRVVTPGQCILCPVCFGKTACHQRTIRSVRHSYSWHTGVIWLEVESVRQRCVSCDLTFTYDFELGLQRGSTAYFREQIVKRCHGRPLTQVADEYGIPYTTLERWFYDHTSGEMDHQTQTAKHICIDEFALRKGHDYAMAALDADTGQVLHLEPGRDQTAVENLLRVVGSKAHTIISDFAPVMAKAMASITPFAYHVLDRFHLIQFFTEALKRRRKYLQSAKKSFKARFIDRCLTVKPTQLTKEEHSYVASWLEEDWTTRQLYHLLQHVRYVLKSQGIHQSKRRLDDLIKRFGFHECGVAASIMKTIQARYEPMIQTILSPYSNGIMEGTNNKIKLIKRRGFGYRNEKNLFLRIRSETGH